MNARTVTDVFRQYFSVCLLACRGYKQEARVHKSIVIVCALQTGWFDLPRIRTNNFRFPGMALSSNQILVLAFQLAENSNR